MQLLNCTGIIRTDGDQSSFGAYSIKFRDSSQFLTATVKTLLESISKDYPLSKCLRAKVSPEPKWDSPLRKVFGEETTERLIETIRPEENDVIFLAFGDKQQSVRVFVLSLFVFYLNFAAITIGEGKKRVCKVSGGRWKGDIWRSDGFLVDHRFPAF